MCNISYLGLIKLNIIDCAVYIINGTAITINSFLYLIIKLKAKANDENRPPINAFINIYIKLYTYIFW